MELHQLIDLLYEEDCSCALWNGGAPTLCYRRGVKDLHDLLTLSPEKLRDALVADKIIGKGAAALMVLGGVSRVYAGVISEPALAMLTSAGIPVTYGRRVANIINREGTGICPVETLCLDCASAADCLPLIEQFLSTKTF